MVKDSIFAVSKEIEVNDVDEKAVIIKPTGEEIYVLNREEKEILLLFDGERTLSDIDRKLGDEYGNEYVSEEFLAYAEDLLEKGILSAV